MRGSIGGNAGGEYRPTARPCAGAVLIVLAMLASGCASSSRLPWKQVELPSVKLPKPSNSYGVGDRATGRLPWPKIKPASRSLPEPSNNFGVGDGDGSLLPWPMVKPKTLETYRPTSPFRM